MTKTTKALAASADTQSQPAQDRQLEALDRCTRVGGIIAARVNDQLQKYAATLPSGQDDLMDFYYIPGSTTPGGSSTPSRQASGNIPIISAQTGHAAITSCLSRSLGRALDYEALAKSIEASGGPVETTEITEGGLLFPRQKTTGRNSAVSVPR